MNERLAFFMEDNERSKEVELGEILPQLEKLGGLVEDSAERVKRLVERADKLIQNQGPKLGVEAEADISLPRGHADTFSRLLIGRWDKGPASDNADGKWHVIFQAWARGVLETRTDCPYWVYDDDPCYCQSLPSAKLEFRIQALPVLPELLRNYFAKAKEHLGHLLAVQTQLDKLESEIENHEALRGL
jgi:hypothetical protein